MFLKAERISIMSNNKDIEDFENALVVDKYRKETEEDLKIYREFISRQYRKRKLYAYIDRRIDEIFSPDRVKQPRS